MIYAHVLDNALNKLGKWRGVFAGWQLGTRAKGDPECDAVRQHRELTILLRAEASALTMLLIEKGVFTHEDFARALLAEAQKLDADYEKLFPGISTDQNGVNYSLPLARETMRGWKP